MKPYAKDYFFANRTMTKHNCPNCLHSFWVRASFYNCPMCGQEVRTPIIIENAQSFPAIVIDRMNAAFKTTADRARAFVLVQRSLPGYSVEAIKTIWEEVEPYAKD